MIIPILHRSKPRLMFTNILQPIPMCVGFATSPSNSAPPAGCPTPQINSDTIYLEIALDPTG